jgi:uncharacterized delta-60 repeat protein
VPAINGSLDETFGAEGVVISDFGSYDSYSAVLALGDGSILAAGSTGVTALLVRYGATGAIDTSFGDQGHVITQPGARYAAFRAIGLQSDRKIIVAGQASASGHDFAVGRYSAAGVLDTTFGNDGFVLVDFHGGDDIAACMIVRDDDHILLGGKASSGGDAAFALVRLEPDGALDADFGAVGKVSLQISNGEDYIQSIAIDGRGRIMAAGFSAANSGPYNWAVARFAAEGTLDTSFGTNGRVVLTSQESDQAHDLAVLPSGEILVAGSQHADATSRMTLVKLGSNGEIVSSFGVDGWASVDFGTDGGFGLAMLRQADGGLLIAGLSRSSTADVAAIARVDASGMPDPTFDEDGWRSLVLGTDGQGTFHDLTAQPDGKVVAAGWSRNPEPDAVLVRFDI